MGQSRAPDPIALPTSAFAELLERTQRQIYRFMYTLVGNQEEARDGVQDVFIAAWRATERRDPPFLLDSADQAAGDAAMRRWLFHTAYRHTAAILRHRRLIAWESLDADAVDESVHKSSWLSTLSPFEDQLADSEELQALLASLELEDAACLILKFVQGYSAVSSPTNPPGFPRRLPASGSHGRFLRLRAAYFGQTIGKRWSAAGRCARPAPGASRTMALNSHTPTPAPTPLCALYEPMLPLLLADELDAEQIVLVRGHLSGCPFCQQRLRELERIVSPSPSIAGWR